MSVKADPPLKTVFRRKDGWFALPVAMPYEHPLIFGAHEYFWDDDTFHDDCIGIFNFIDERDCDDVISDPEGKTPAKVTKSCSTQTEPWEPPSAPATSPPPRLVRVLPGTTRPNRKFRPDRAIWCYLTPFSPRVADSELEPKRLPKASNSWFERAQGAPNDKEMLFFTGLVATNGSRVAEQVEWATEVLTYESAFRAHGAAGLPEHWRPSKQVNIPAIFKPLGAAYSSKWPDARLDQIGKAMHAWDGEGQHALLEAGNLKYHRSQPPRGPPRWKTFDALFSVAGTIKRHGVKLRQLLKIEEPVYEIPTPMEVVQQRAETAEETVNQLRLDLKAETKKKEMAQAAHRQSSGRLSQKTKAVSKARKEERDASKEKLKAKLKKENERQRVAAQKVVETLREESARELEAKKANLEEKYGEKYTDQQKYLTTARARARAAERERDAVVRKVARLENKIERMETESDDADDESDGADDESDASDPTRQLPFELLPRRDEHGRWQAESPDVHSVRLAQIARGVAPSTVAMNIADVLAIVAPGVDVPGTCKRQSQQLRTEVTVCSQAMAAFKFASAIRILSFGWDESTKFGDGVFSCNAQVQYADGTIENICLRGLSILPEGGTSAAVLAHIERRIFAHSRRLLCEWKTEYEKVSGGAGSWAAAGYPSPDNIGLHRLAEDTVLCTDTCNGARCTRRMLAEAIMLAVKELIGVEAWEAMSEEERDGKFKTFRGDCWQHMRNIVIDAMAAKGDEMLRLEVADDLATFSAFERIEPEGGSMIHACFKHFHHGGEYHHGRGREYTVWCEKPGFASRLLPRFERSCGNRQDLRFDGCIPLLLHRRTIAEFLRGYLDCPKSEGKLDKSIYTVMRCNEFTGLLCANSLWKYVFSEPFRWLSGKGAQLEGWSLFKLAEALEMVEKTMEAVAADPRRALDPSLNIFAPVAEELPEFKKYQAELLAQKVTAADGETEYYIMQEVLKLVRTPPAGSGEEAAQPFTLKVLKAQAERALEKMHDKRLALANKLTSQDGDYAMSKNADGHRRTMGCNTTNDSVENKFATGDFVMRTFRKISVANASGIVEQRNAHDFDRAVTIVSDRRKRKVSDEPEKQQVGFFWRLTEAARHALIRVGRRLAPEERSGARADKKAHDAEKLARREEAVQRQLLAAIERYAEALELFDAWRARSVGDSGKPLNAEELKRALDAELRGKSDTEKLTVLRQWIEMRSKGLGWTEYAPQWGFDPDQKAATAAAWRELLLNDIFPHELQLRRRKQLPKAAAPPQLRVRLAKTLGTADPDVLALEDASLFCVDRLLERAEAARLRREAAGISCGVELRQPPRPAFDSQLVGRWLEICWPYKKDGKMIKIWAPGQVKRVADGLTSKRSERCKTILPAGALLWAWEADAEFGEKAGEQWMVLHPDKYNKHVQYAWRFDPCELRAPGQPKERPRAPQVEDAVTDDEFYE